jgi:hypothetical protein
MTAHTYNAGKVGFVWGGMEVTREPGEDAFIKVTRDEPAFTKKVGVKGRATRNQSNNRGAQVEVNLMYTSPENKLLMAAHIADLKTGNGSGIAPGTIYDSLNKAELHIAPSMWIAETPDFELAKEVGEITWVFDCEAMEDMFAGR